MSIPKLDAEIIPYELMLFLKRWSLPIIWQFFKLSSKSSYPCSYNHILLLALRFLELSYPFVNQFSLASIYTFGRISQLCFVE